MSDVFFSDSLKDVIDEQSLLGKKQLKFSDTESEVLNTASFVSFSLLENVMTLKVSHRVVKLLLVNEEQVVSYNFMDEVWSLSPRGMKVKLEKDDSYCVTLQINDRSKEDNYEWTI